MAFGHSEFLTPNPVVPSNRGVHSLVILPVKPFPLQRDRKQADTGEMKDFHLLARLSKNLGTEPEPRAREGGVRMRIR